MPGLFGLVNENSANLVQDLASIGRVLKSGYETVHDQWVDEACRAGLGRVSLGIYEPQHQPVFNADRILAAVFDGKLVGMEQPRRALADEGLLPRDGSDAQLALALYEKEGVSGLSRLNGIFATAIWDSRNRRLVVANDRFGLRPVYYTCKPGLFAFASEVKGLLTINGIGRSIDDEALADFLAYEQLLESKTFFSDIRLLPPASILLFQDQELAHHHYWEFRYQEVTDTARPDHEWVEEMLDRLTQAVSNRLEGSQQVGLPLSGGLDSRLLLAVLDRLGAHLPTYTYGLPESKDLLRARHAAELVHFPHHDLILDPDYLSKFAEQTVERADGMLNCICSHGFALHKMAEECQVMMLGNGCDSMLWTWRSYKPGLQRIPEGDIFHLFQELSEAFSEHDLANLCNPTFFTRIKGRALASLEKCFSQLKPNSWDNNLDELSMREIERRYTLMGLATINHRLEYSEPYYDYDLVDFALTVPQHMRQGRKIQKMALTHLSPILAKAPGGPVASQDQLQGNWLRNYWRRGQSRLMQVAKQARKAVDPRQESRVITWNVAALLRTIERKWVEELLFSSRSLERGYFDPAALRSLVDDHMNGRKNLSKQLGVLLTFELWHRCYVD